MRPTAAQVWDAIQTDPGFAAEAPADSPQREIIRPFIEGSVTALDSQLDTVVTLQTLADAKVAFLRYCLEHNLGRAMSNALGVSEGMLTMMLQRLVDMFAQITSDMDAFLKENGITEDEVMAGPQIGLNATCKQKWQDGTLTIGELLLLQPAIILQNSN